MTENIEKLVECAICFNTIETPKMLPCQHTFCLNPCLKSMVDVLKAKIKCAICRREVKLPEEGLQNLPSNILLSNLIETLQETKIVDENEISDYKPSAPPMTEIVNDFDFCYRITLKGRCLEFHGRTSGIYKLQPNFVNGRYHWLQENGPYAIWFDQSNQSWKIGLTTNLGTVECSIYGAVLKSRNDLPHEINGHWKYFDNKWQLMNENEIVVEKIKRDQKDLETKRDDKIVQTKALPMPDNQDISYKVDLKGVPLERLGRFHGNYSMQPTLVNGRYHWLHENGQYAIWFHELHKFWLIGSVTILGTKKAAPICAPIQFIDSLPHEVKCGKWRYYCKKKWHLAEQDEVSIVKIDPEFTNRSKTFAASNDFVKEYQSSAYRITLRDRALAKHSAKSGIYLCQASLVNERNHWLQIDGKNAIWYDNVFNNWKIGTTDNLGTIVSGIKGPENLDVLPHNIITPYWGYYSSEDKQWFKSRIGANDDILIEELVVALQVKISPKIPLHQSKNGIYHFKKSENNFPDHWLHRNGLYAIWHGGKTKRWFIGNVSNLGTSICNIRGPAFNFDPPHQIPSTNWQYCMKTSFYDYCELIKIDRIFVKDFH